MEAISIEGWEQTLRILIHEGQETERSQTSRVREGAWLNSFHDKTGPSEVFSQHKPLPALPEFRQIDFTDAAG